MLAGEGGAVPDRPGRPWSPPRPPTAPPPTPYRLFQPLSQRYYLVTPRWSAAGPESPTTPCSRPRGETELRRAPADRRRQRGGLDPGHRSRRRPRDPPTGSGPPPPRLAARRRRGEAAHAPGARSPPSPTCGTVGATFGMAETGIGRTVYLRLHPGQPARAHGAGPGQTPRPSPRSSRRSPPAGDPLLNPLWTRVIVALGPAPEPAACDARDARDAAGRRNTGYASLYLLLDLADWLQASLPIRVPGDDRRADGRPGGRRGWRRRSTAIHVGTWTTAGQPPRPSWPSATRCAPSRPSPPWSPGPTSPGPLPGTTS